LHNQAQERGLIFSRMSVKPKDETTMNLITKATPISIGHFDICLGIFVVMKNVYFCQIFSHLCFKHHVKIKSQIRFNINSHHISRYYHGSYLDNTSTQNFDSQKNIW
jgi:hypothetical protein